MENPKSEIRNPKLGRTPFPRVFWVANSVEVLERFAYYGIYIGFGIYMEYLGYSKDQLGIVQSLFLLFSYCHPGHLGHLRGPVRLQEGADRLLPGLPAVDPAADPDEVVLGDRPDHAEHRPGRRASSSR